MSNWKDRLRAFDDLAPDEAVYTRAAQGPRHDVPDEPNGRKRLVAGMVAFAVFGAAAVFGWQAFKWTADQPAGPSTTAVVITLIGTEAEPTATVNFDNSWQAGVFEKYTWCSTPDDCSSVDNDLAYPPIQEGVEVPVGAPIRFAGDAQVERAVIRTTEGDQASRNVIADTDGSAISVPDVPGDYLIWIAADWAQGSGAFYLRIRATPVQQASGGMTQSGGTYRLFDMSVMFPPGQSEETSHASISYSYEWTTEFFPGEAQCTFSLFDESGVLVTEYQTGLVSVSPTLSASAGHSFEVPVPGGTTPTSAEGSCGPGVVYGGPWDISNLRVEDSTVVGELSLVGDDSEGMAACALRWLDSSSTEHITAGSMGIVGSSRNREFFRLPDDAAQDLVPQVRCESYRSPDQLGEAHWLPWPELQVTPSMAAADVLSIVCTENGTQVPSPLVQAQDDGVHVEVDNQAGVDEVLFAPAGNGGDGWGGDMDLSEGTSHVFDFAPGDLVVGCFADMNLPNLQVEDWSELPGMVPVTITEPAGGYVSAELSCPAGVRTRGITSFWNSGPIPTPEEAARALLIGLEETDVIERAGYPAQRAADDLDEGVGLRIVRGGEVVASVVVTQVGTTPILRAEACEQSGIAGAPALGGGSPTPGT